MKKTLGALLVAGAIALTPLSSAGAARAHKTSHKVTSECRLAIEGYQQSTTLYAKLLIASEGYLDQLQPAEEAGANNDPTALDNVTAAIDATNTSVENIGNQIEALLPSVHQDAALCLAGK